MSNIRISESTPAVLRPPAADEGESMQAVLDKAVEKYRSRHFWERVAAAAGHFPKDSPTWQEEMAKRLAWDATLNDGLDDR